MCSIIWESILSTIYRFSSYWLRSTTTMISTIWSTTDTIVSKIEKTSISRNITIRMNAIISARLGDSTSIRNTTNGTNSIWCIIKSGIVSSRRTTKFSSTKIFARIIPSIIIINDWTISISIVNINTATTTWCYNYNKRKCYFKLSTLRVDSPSKPRFVMYIGIKLRMIAAAITSRISPADMIATMTLRAPDHTLQYT